MRFSLLPGPWSFGPGTFSHTMLIHQSSILNMTWQLQGSTYLEPWMVVFRFPCSTPAHEAITVSGIPFSLVDLGAAWVYGFQAALGAPGFCMMSRRDCHVGRNAVDLGPTKAVQQIGESFLAGQAYMCEPVSLLHVELLNRSHSAQLFAGGMLLFSKTRQACKSDSRV